MIRQARELGIETQFLSTVNFYDEESIKAGGEYVEGVIFSSPVFDPTSDDPNVKSFVQRFRARYQSDPDVWSAHGYDAMELLAYAINKEGFSSDDIKRGLYSIRDFPGVSGKTSFDENGDVEKAARFLTVKQGKFVPLQDTISAHGRSN